MTSLSLLLISSTLLLLQAPLSLAQMGQALLCTEHPAFTPSLTSVLVRSWTVNYALPPVEQVAYLPRYLGHGYTPVDDASSKKYVGLDLFHTANAMDAPNFRVNFQRSALVYLFVNVDSKQFNDTETVSLQGWNSEGWAKRSFGDDRITYGVYQKLTRKMSKYVYVFSKTTTEADYVDVPQAAFIKDRIEGVSVPGSFNLWIAESDGFASKPVGKLNGEDVKANKQCPQELHDAWRVEVDESDHPSVKGALFRTWHPQWDPCFWCTYGHEHGSSPKELMGYVPKFDFLQAKGGPSNEPDSGFKGYVLRTKDHFIYLNLHSLTSTPRRVLKRFYTITFVVVDRLTNKILVDLQYQADLGFAAVKLKDGSFRPISNRDVAIRDAQEMKESTKFRSVNILNLDKPNPDYVRRMPIQAGVLEEWRMSLLCSKPGKLSNAFSAIFREPSTGIKSQQEKLTSVKLGRFLGSTNASMFYQNPGLYRSLRFADLTFSSESCPEGASGEFYTDIDGNVVDGPGPFAVRQYFKKNLSVTIDGRWEAADSSVGLYFKGARGFFVNHGYGTDPEKN